MFQSKNILFLIPCIIVLFISGCSDKYYEMHKSPCACLSQKEIQNIQYQIYIEELKKQNDLQKNQIQKDENSKNKSNKKSQSYRKFKSELSIKLLKYGISNPYENLLKITKKD
ncbi:hypothetical protein BKH42_08200 [Helicobacter sp. 13S00482-2]|uniref:hypothetical protein n=1 Tax=Helicobacter sp. 13S00482-2 TaxID=1476200 RepID=UPI000BA6C3CD|nr:hypothetical protein [Helicobacter sp. 13S00482-2]PAF53026.1 hypothetical protein BKH42_08200 [Helicobacter sp. 13S00482-2]